MVNDTLSQITADILSAKGSNRQAYYSRLVNWRKASEEAKRYFAETGMHNQSDYIALFTENEIKDAHINPWEQWHNCLNPTYTIVGQDFSDIGYFIKLNGSLDAERRNNTNNNLADFCAVANIPLGRPYTNINDSNIFMTNAILGLKPTVSIDGKKGMSASIPTSAFPKSNDLLSAILELLRTNSKQVIITLGLPAFKSVLATLHVKPIYTTSQLSSIAGIPFQAVADNRWIVPMFHPAARPLNRTKDQQFHDWKTLGTWLQSEGFV